MADLQDQPDGEPTAESSPPAKKAPAKKAPAKKAPAKKAAAKTAPAKKAPAKKAPAETAVPAPPKAVEQPPEQPAVQPATPQPAAPQPAAPQQRAETNGQLAAAKDVAAQAKSTVESAKDPLPPALPESSTLQSPVVWVVAATLSLLATLLIRQLRRR